MGGRKWLLENPRQPRILIRWPRYKDMAPKNRPGEPSLVLVGTVLAIDIIEYLHSTYIEDERVRLHDKYNAWRITGILPWASLLFTTGFIMREVSAYNPDNLGIFIASIVLLLVAPPVYAAANYFILGHTLYYIPYLTPMHPGRVVSTFLGLDFIVGALTGSGAGRISNYSDPQQQSIGTSLIKASLLLQVGLFCGFIAVEIIFHIRCIRARVLTPRIRTIIYLLYASNALILVRNIYRVIETFQGYGGYLETHEAFFYVFDGLLMLVNSVMFNVFHPARFLPKSNKTYLAQDGVTEREGPGWVDKRPFIITVFDPFDIGGLILGRDKGNKFWEEDDASAN
ncbi:MAG: hypothetical protein Q9187_000867 [Circinaria calcarea]